MVREQLGSIRRKGEVQVQSSGEADPPVQCEGLEARAWPAFRGEGPSRRGPAPCARPARSTQAQRRGTWVQLEPRGLEPRGTAPGGKRCPSLPCRPSPCSPREQPPVPGRLGTGLLSPRRFPATDPAPPASGSALPGASEPRPPPARSCPTWLKPGSGAPDPSWR